MKIKSLLTLSLLAALAIGMPSSGLAAPKKEKPATGEKTDAAATTSKPIPYHGKVAAVDAAAKTFTIKGKQKDRVFAVTDKTVITKDGATADLATITAGEEVQGSATKTGDNWEALKVIVGAKAAGKGAKKEEAKPTEPAPAAAAPAPAASPAPGAAPAGDAPAK
jgi:hypothetical protein